MENTTISQVIAKAMEDPEFKQKLLKNPESTLRAEGIEIPQGVRVTVCEETDKQRYLVLPDTSKLSEEQLESIAGGGLDASNFRREADRAEVLASARAEEAADLEAMMRARRP